MLVSIPLEEDPVLFFIFVVFRPNYINDDQQYTDYTTVDHKVINAYNYDSQNAWHAGIKRIGLTCPVVINWGGYLRTGLVFCVILWGSIP